ncbi:MAG TPA: PPOX class F420-dependent oxidoreductase [Candidatus Ruania gallistercoris]|uniref:PPOX class F420-dependent oxidoreductase n=1 Tax=Candidatus Ruania gallistercoris TaxID=2838746 RepID=A0A9D2EGP7_9MICO|nr:PPOX class F420-dependent oxidoreductase [Candidatus Ruania gallistercoris]
MTAMSEAAKQLLNEPEYAVLATVEPDGQPQLSVVWMAREHSDVLISTVRGRRKEQNLRRDPRATLLLYPADNPQEYVEIRGQVTLDDDPDGSLIQALSQKYTGKPYTADEGTDHERVVVRLRPHHVVHRIGH